MRLLNLKFRRNHTSSAPRRTRAFRAALQPYLEGLEERTVLSGPGAGVVAAAVQHSPLTITGVNVTNLAVTGANTLQATLDLSGTLNTRTSSTPFTLHNLQLPITLTTSAPAAAATAGVATPPVGTSILHLSLQIPDLNLLGLHVQLDNCNNGPVTVDITAIPSTQPGGGLLGDLLTSVDTALSGSGGLLNLGGLTNQVTGALTTVLNGHLDRPDDRQYRGHRRHDGLGRHSDRHDPRRRHRVGQPAPGPDQRRHPGPGHHHQPDLPERLRRPATAASSATCSPASTTCSITAATTETPRTSWCGTFSAISSNWASKERIRP